MSEVSALPQPLSRLRLPALVVGIVALAATGAWMYYRPEQGFRSYLLGYMLFLGIALGAMGLAMVHQLVGGEWGYLIRRLHEAAALTLPLMLVGFIPIALGASHLYPWADPQALAHDDVLRHRQPYLNERWFIIRAAIYFAVWIFFAFTLRRWSLRQDANDSHATSVRLQKLSAAGILCYILTMTAAAIDWLMSRDPHYYSTIFGFIIVVGQALSAMALAVLLLAWLSDRPPYASIVRGGHFNDLGNLLLTLVILFAYLAFAQFLVNWSGNSQQEITWYIARTRGGWQWLAALIILFHFFVPFFLLLSRFNKQKVRIIGRIAALLLVMRAVDLFWMVAPSDAQGAPHLGIYWTDFAGPIGIGGIWFACFAWILARRPLLPRYSFGLPETVAHGQAAHGNAG